MTRAATAWAQAEYDDLFSLADGSNPAVSVLAAHAYIRVGDPASALDVLDAVRSRDAQSRPRMDVLRAYAQYMSRKAGATPDPEPFSYAIENGDRESEALAHYFSAVSAWSFGRLDAVEKHLGAMSPEGSVWLGALAVELRAWLEVQRGRFAAAARRFIETLDALHAYEAGDAHLRMNAIFGLSFIALETFDLDLVVRLRTEILDLPTTPSLNKLKALALTCIAMSLELCGDDAEALELLLEARALPVRAPFSALPMIECAAFHKRAGETRSAQIHMNAARSLLESVDWTDADIEARTLLLTYATHFARDDYAASARAFTQASSYKGRRDLMLAFEHDDRVQALASFASAKLAEARGDAATAISGFERSAKIWSAMGYRLRAAQAERAFSQLTPHLPAVTPNLDVIRRETPRSWVVVEAGAAPPFTVAMPSHFINVGPAEQRVLELICQGLTSKQIAAKVGRSVSTVRNQTIRLYRTFEVNDRRSLALKIGTIRSGAHAAAAGDLNRLAPDGATRDVLDNRKQSGGRSRGH